MAAPLTWLKTDGVRNTDGSVIASASIFFYVPGTTTQVAVYADANETSTLSQPVTCNAAGQAEVYVDRIVKMVVQDSAGATVHTIERASAFTAAQMEIESDYFTGTRTNGTTGTGGRLAASTAFDYLGASLGGTDGNFKDSSGGTNRAVRVALVERGLSVKDRGAMGDGLTTDTAAFRSAIAILKARSPSGGTLIVPPGTYLVDDVVGTIDFNGLVVEGAGINASVIKSTVTNKNLFTISDGFNFVIRDIQLTASSASSAYGIQCSGDGAWIQRVKITKFAECIRFDATAFEGIVDSCNLTAASAGICVHIKDTGTIFHRFINTYFDGTDQGGEIGVKVADAAGGVVLMGCHFGELLSTGVNVTVGFTGSHVSVIGCDLSLPDTAPITISATGEIKFSEYGNKWGSGTITDAAAGSVWGSFPGGRKGTDITAAAAIAPRGGRYFAVAGNTNIDHIETTGRVVGETITLQFSGTPTVNDNTGGAAAGYAPIQLTAGFTASAGDNLVLLYDGTDWKEVSRAVI